MILNKITSNVGQALQFPQVAALNKFRQLNCTLWRPGAFHIHLPPLFHQQLCHGQNMVYDGYGYYFPTMLGIFYNKYRHI